MKKWRFNLAVCLSCFFLQPCFAILEQLDPVHFLSADEYTVLVPGRGSPDLRLEEISCPQKVKVGFCSWWREGNCGCCQLKAPGYYHVMFWGSITGLIGVAALCVWHYGKYGPKCEPGVAGC